jgi:amino acid transporter
MLAALAATTVLYVLIQIVCLGTLPGLAHSERPLADASVRFLGPAGGTLIVLGALVSTIGTQCGSLLIGSRLLFAMADQDQVPRVLARVGPRFRTPHVAILVTAGAALALMLSGTFSYVLGLNVVTRLATFVLTAGALIAFRRRPAEERAARFSLPGGEGLAIVGIAACIWLAARNGSAPFRDLSIALGAGLVLTAAQRWSARLRR